jgi:hypothetical protein
MAKQLCDHIMFCVHDSLYFNLLPFGTKMFEMVNIIYITH